MVGAAPAGLGDLDSLDPVAVAVHRTFTAWSAAAADGVPSLSGIPARISATRLTSVVLIVSSTPCTEGSLTDQ
jgi:hypothetical protein